MTTIVDLYKNVFGGEEPEDEILATWKIFNMLGELPELRGPDKMMRKALEHRARGIISFAYLTTSHPRYYQNSGRLGKNLSELADAMMGEDRVKIWAARKDFSLGIYSSYLKETLRATFKRRHDELEINLHIHFKDAFTGKDRVFAEDLFNLEYGPFPS